MAAGEIELLGALEAMGIAVQVHRHPPLMTVEDSKALRGDIPGPHVKNLFLKDKKQRLWLVTALEDTPVNLKTLDKVIGSARLSFGKPELLAEVLGVKPGSVTPFAVMNDADARVTLVLDTAMMQHKTINAHPLHNEATVTIGTEGLLAFVRKNGHEPVIVEIGG